MESLSKMMSYSPGAGWKSTVGNMAGTVTAGMQCAKAFGSDQYQNIVNNVEAGKIMRYTLTPLKDAGNYAGAALQTMPSGFGGNLLPPLPPSFRGNLLPPNFGGNLLPPNFIGNLPPINKRKCCYIAGGIVVGAAVGAAVLPVIGFGSGGVVASSTAAVWQAYIGNVAAGSTFAALQSFGATGGATYLAGAGGVAAGVAVAYFVKPEEKP